METSVTIYSVPVLDIIKIVIFTLLQDMPFHCLPDVQRCCYCITNLKTATTVIAVLGIVSQYFLLKYAKYDNKVS